MLNSGEYMAYITKQHELVLNVLKSVGGHITAQSIAKKLDENGNYVGVSTVYRQLDKLVESGKVRKYIVEDGKSACYEYVGESGDCQRHYHLKCSGCGRLLHVECEYLDKIEAHILEHHGFVLNNEKTVLYGMCEDCRKKEEK